MLGSPCRVSNMARTALELMGCGCCRADRLVQRTNKLQRDQMEAHNAHHHLDMGGSSFGGSIMAATDFLMVDDLLDFSNEEIAGPIGDSCNNNETNTNTNAESSVLTDSTTIADTIHFDAGDYPPQDLCVPLDEVAELEWLSNFVEDSFSTESVSAAAAAAELSNTANNGGHESTATKKTLIINNNNNNDNDYSAETAEENTAELHPVRGRARSKRSRAAVCNWVSYLLSPTSSATTKLSDSCGSSSASECSNQPNCGSSALVAASKPKKRTTAAAATTAVEERKCSHCGTHKTPQWRAGPEGPKTLCNACGVRFKSGRLLPEYRPASSPSFVVSLHSNSHRKVLEMRRKKQQQQQVQSHKHHLQELVQGLIRGSSSSSSTGTVAPTSTHDASTSAHSVFMEKKFDDECLLHTANTSVVVEHSFCRV